MRVKVGAADRRRKDALAGALIAAEGLDHLCGGYAQDVRHRRTSRIGDEMASRGCGTLWLRRRVHRRNGP